MLAPKRKAKPEEDDDEDAAPETAPPTKSPRKSPKKKDEDEAGPSATGEKAKAPKKSSGAGPTASEKAIAKGAEAIPRSETPRSPAPAGTLTLIHWNVGGLNGLLNNAERKERLVKLVATEKPDLLAFSEHKLSEEKVTKVAQELLAVLPEYKAHWAVSTAKKGYSGVAVLIKKGTKVTSVELDQVGTLHEGRTVTVELEHMYAVAAYVPNSGQKLERLDYRVDEWDPALRAYLQQLERTKPVVLYGDLNVGHRDADIWNFDAKHIPKSAGLTARERDSFSTLLSSEGGGFVDCFRALHPDAAGAFSYWSTRAGNEKLNRGLRLDYAVASAALVGDVGGASFKLHSCDMLQEYAPNGDHAPLLAALAPRE